MEERSKKKVIIAIEESECSLYALEWALTNLKETISSSGLVIFSVQPISELAYVQACAFGMAHQSLIAAVQERQKHLALFLLEKAKEICARRGVLAETVTEAGDPKEAICKAAEKLNAKLLVVGSHCRGVLQRAFLGSVSNYCFHNAKCPVLVVKKRA